MWASCSVSPERLMLSSQLSPNEVSWGWGRPGQFAASVHLPDREAGELQAGRLP